MKLNTNTRLGLGFGVQILLAGVLGTSVLLGMATVQRQFQFVVEHDAPVIANAQRLSKLVVDMETGQRGFVITANDEFLEPFDSGAKEFDALIEREIELVSDNVGQVAALERIARLVVEWKEKAAQPEIAMARKVAAQTDADSLQLVSATDVRERLTSKHVAALLQTGTGKTLIDEIRRQFDRFIEIEEKLAAERYATATQAARDTRRNAIALLVIAIGFGIGIALVTSRAIARPLAKLARAVEAVGSGDLVTQVRAESTDEIGNLALSFNVMVSRLREADTKRSQLEGQLFQAQKLEAVGRLAAGIAHEINNPMSYVRSNLNRLFEEWSEVRSTLEKLGTPESRGAVDLCQELLEDCLEGVERTVAIVRDVQEFSRMDGERGAVDLASVVDGALRVATSLANPGIQFECEVEPVTGVCGSVNQLRQVVVNLIVNAIHAVGDVGHIRISATRDRGEAVVRVEDDGPGIPPDVREHLFEPFFTTKAVGLGTGLGLYISYEIAKNHGGEILVRSDPGCGSTFELRLPLT